MVEGKLTNTTKEKHYHTRLAIVELLQSGVSGRETAKILGVSVGYVSRIKKDFEQNGYAALALYKRGTPWGNETQEMWRRARTE